MLGGVVAGTLVVAFRDDPGEPGHYPGCPFLALTGFYCPGCGMTRFVYALTHGHLGAAFGFNPLLFVVLPVFGYLYVRWTVRTAQGLPMRSALLRPGGRVLVRRSSHRLLDRPQPAVRARPGALTRGPSAGAATIGARNDLK
ncbi:DUF2752 domain-containing protein [Actinomadura madurae]|uniref:DUF2752 domain-containing protein n=1 Tax=Actinomadura madurae TaxID=1993 RepID=UPI0020D1F574|nr:DUF2752 domain-containing protein [Actinomadura madurae]MCP9984250.1 DUF2752 domain-containing protein [Actinomadura madurae]